ncbi:16S rRNA (guanine(527)-N(7))-methyltransferase RsmG [Alteromonas sediminis]|uniref:Ribosomal RNA small subunit methyltransferase G n=1 Tax=Alteromonas sediminis TaxID=2259342 RepID=A0A3N5Y1C6_9ALTE|nr:16S rRNA (guanine(527)-N(7))-methyltransferase RsmG [Alteromonas sediminis]RPJ66763.1 16S rRNA (guanine(527)-N(7))-methyltransferase RsmG [Alteromonas sediminis]
MSALNREVLESQLKQAASQFDFGISETQQAKLIDYVCMIHKWNKAYNLTSVREPEAMLTKHIVDSVAVMPYLQGSRFIDVGTGPGLPGIPLAIMMPHAQFTLLDSLGKRVRFMKQCAHEMKIENIFPIQSRVEDHCPEKVYDGVLSRAFASLKDMLHWCEHLVDSKGAFFALKGQLPSEELAQIPGHFTVETAETLLVPGLEGQRHLVVIKKT